MIRCCRKLLLPVFLSLSLSNFAITAQPVSQASTGIIVGRIMIDDKPAVGVIVMLTRESPNSRDVLLKATTDDDGRYTLSGVPSGSWRLMPMVPAYTVADVNNNQPGRIIHLSEGETLDHVDFKLIPGGVITGKVMTAENSPIIGQQVMLMIVMPNGERRPWYPQTWEMMKTDDRGTYRIYGLAAGKYLLGFNATSSNGPAGVNGLLFKKTWHPSALSEAQAKIIEVSPGSETTEVNIILNATEQAFTISGRVIDDETNRPLTGIRVTATSPSGSAYGLPPASCLAGASGEFRIEGVSAGMRMLITSPADNDPSRPHPYYSDPVSCEIMNTDVSGIEIRLRRAGSVSGIIIPEPGIPPEILVKLRQATIQASTLSNKPGYVHWAYARQAANGSFRLDGMAPGKLSLQISAGQETRQFVVLRMERDGVEQRGGIEVGPGEQVTGLRVITGYAGSSITGQVIVEGGELPAGAKLQIFCRQAESRFGGGTAEADARGRFVLAPLSAGTYEVQVMMHFKTPDGSIINRPGLMLVPNKFPVTLGSNDTQQVMLNVRLQETPKPKGIPQ